MFQEIPTALQFFLKRHFAIDFMVSHCSEGRDFCEGFYHDLSWCLDPRLTPAFLDKFLGAHVEGHTRPNHSAA